MTAGIVGERLTHQTLIGTAARPWLEALLRLGSHREPGSLVCDALIDRDFGTVNRSTSEVRA